jgi:hypothetical protein
MDDPNLPAAYGKTRLVLLVVDPYLIQAYWEVAPEKLREAKQQTGQAKGVLRFYMGSKVAGEDALPGSFDIEVDLQSRNWYVHLWSPEESLCADLALKGNDGTLIRLARSQVVHMPRVRPAIAIDQHFMRVEATERRAEIVPAPPAEYDRPQQDVPPPPPAAERERPQQDMPRLQDELHVHQIVKPMDSGEIVREKLKNLYASVHWRRSRFELETVRAIEIPVPLPGRAGADLTAIAERSLPADASSGALQKSRVEAGPDTTK